VGKSSGNHDLPDAINLSPIKVVAWNGLWRRQGSLRERQHLLVKGVQLDVQGILLGVTLAQGGEKWQQQHTPVGEAFFQ